MNTHNNNNRDSTAIIEHSPVGEEVELPFDTDLTKLLSNLTIAKTESYEIKHNIPQFDRLTRYE